MKRGRTHRGLPKLFLPPLLVALMLSSCSAETSAPVTSSRKPGPEKSHSLEQPKTPRPTPARVAKKRHDKRWVTPRPSWLGKRVLPRGPSGFGMIKPTPRILLNRRFATIDILPRPTGRRFKATIGPVPRPVANRSTWRPKCPVALGDLSYVTMPFWGFDHKRHTGEMIVNAAAAEEVVGVFHTLYRSRFPIEEMRVVTLEEQREWHTKSTGDTNVTSSFECRKATLGDSWSEHSYGLAIDINPFHNPYLNGGLVAPELATAYTDRNWKRPGMILEGDLVTEAFDAIGWGWGGRWTSIKDWMHFSQGGN